MALTEKFQGCSNPVQLESVIQCVDRSNRSTCQPRRQLSVGGWTSQPGSIRSAQQHLSPVENHTVTSPQLRFLFDALVALRCNCNPNKGSSISSELFRHHCQLRGSTMLLTARQQLVASLQPLQAQPFHVTPHLQPFHTRNSRSQRVRRQVQAAEQYLPHPHPSRGVDLLRALPAERRSYMYPEPAYGTMLTEGYRCRPRQMVLNSHHHQTVLTYNKG